MHLDRMYLLLQRLRRNKNFSRPAFEGLKASSHGFIEVRPRAFLVKHQVGKHDTVPFVRNANLLSACSMVVGVP